MTQIKEVKITEDSIRTELHTYENKPYDCLFEYIWNAFDAAATEVDINYSIPKSGIGYVESVQIIDNGKGWNFEGDANTATFLSSTKAKNNNKDKTLPMGRLGRGRYVFIWLADKLEVYSNNKKILLTHDTKYSLTSSTYSKDGTKICFLNINDIFSSALLAEKNLRQEIILAFGWFIKENNNLKIRVNGSEINPVDNIKESASFLLKDFSSEVTKYLTDHNLKIEVILWKDKPSEWSNFYFLDKDGGELFKKSTGLNKKSDSFWHSVYITSDFFINEDIDFENQDYLQNNLGFSGDQASRKKAKRKLLLELKAKIIKLRKPYLIDESSRMIEDFKENKILPNLPDYGVYDETSYNDLLKTVYVISPSLFVGKSDVERKFICATFAALLSTHDNHLIQKILEQLQELDEEERKDLLEILERTSLSNIVNTLKEIDHRLELVEVLKVLLFEKTKETLEVKHLQKVLNEDFWIFGEQFRLFSNTEGPLKKVLLDYAKEILEIEDPELSSKPRGEVDLFLTRTEPVTETKQKNIIVEIKRPSKVLGKKEFDQIEKYMMGIKDQNICNGANQYWEFYLVGNDYDNYIKDKHEQIRALGEIDRGLVITMNDNRFKIYIRKWSDILEVEWGTKMKYLKDKLQIESRQVCLGSSQSIVDGISKKK